MAYIGVSPSNGVRRVHTYTATASQTTFSGAGAEGTSLSYKDSNFVDVYQNGIKLGDADYTSTSGTSIVLAQGASADDLVVVVVFDVFSVADTVSKADGGTFDGAVTLAGGVSGNTTFSNNVTVTGDLASSTSGTSNFRAGVNAGNSIASGGNYNTVIGDEAGTALTTGDDNVAVGYAALKTEDANGRNVAVGYEALEMLNAGADGENVAVGYRAGEELTEGIQNTLIGAQAGDSLTHADYNVAIGRNALTTDTQGHKSVAIGAGALGTQNFTSSTDTNNIAIGYNAGADLTDAERCVLIGGLAGEEITTADDNVAIGYRSGGGGAGSATTGHDNVSIGTDAGEVLTSGNQNTLIGRDAGDAITTGQGNICIGHGATTATSDRIFSITMGRDVASVGDYYFTFGVDASVHRVYNNFTSNASWTRQSDERIKKDITTNTDCGLDFINDLRTVTYKFKAPSELDPSMTGYDESKTETLYKNKMYGFIAQEVKSAMDTHNITDFSGWHQVDDGGDNMQGISYEMFVMPLVKAVQELSAKVTALETENATQATQIADLISRVTALENAE